MWTIIRPAPITNVSVLAPEWIVGAILLTALGVVLARLLPYLVESWRERRLERLRDRLWDVDVDDWPDHRTERRAS